MSDQWTALTAIVGGGGTLGLVAAIIVFVTRGAIATAVTQAGAREIERLKVTLAAEANRELERFKAELTFDAEVRRQAAARKVTALVKVADLTHTLISRALFRGNANDRINAVDEYLLATREAEPFVGRDMLAEMTLFGALLQNSHGVADQPGAAIMDLSEKAEAARRVLLTALRRELQGSRDEGRGATEAKP